MWIGILRVILVVFIVILFNVGWVWIVWVIFLVVILVLIVKLILEIILEVFVFVIWVFISRLFFLCVISCKKLLVLFNDNVWLLVVNGNLDIVIVILVFLVCFLV